MRFETPASSHGAGFCALGLLPQPVIFSLFIYPHPPWLRGTSQHGLIVPVGVRRQFGNQSSCVCFFFLFFFLSLLFRLIIRIVSAQVVLYLYKARRLVLDWMEHRRCRVRCVLCAVRPRNAPARGGAREITITAAKKMIKMIKMIAYELLTVRSTPSARRCLGGVSFHVAVPGLTSRTTYRIPYKAGP